MSLRLSASSYITARVRLYIPFRLAAASAATPQPLQPPRRVNAEQRVPANQPGDICVDNPRKGSG